MALFTQMSARMDTLINKVNYMETKRKLDDEMQEEELEDDSANNEEQAEEQRLLLEAASKDAAADAAQSTGAQGLAPSLTTEAGRAFTRTNRGQKTTEFRPY